MDADAPRPATVLSSLNGGLHALMDADPRVVVLGEDILDPYGGAFKVTRGLSSRFPDRVITTPISEAGIVGVAIGMALRGFRPIVEVMFGDFLVLAADQLINHAAKLRWMYEDRVQIPLVVRTPMGGRRGYGSTHSQCLEKHFLGVPGLWVVAPHVHGDPGILLCQATLACDDPVVFIESKTCYSRQLMTDGAGLRAETYPPDAPFPVTYLTHGTAAHPDAVLFCYGATAPLCRDAVQQLRDQEGLTVDLAVFTQLSPTPMDQVRWVMARARPDVCAYVEESSAMGGWSAEMLAAVEEGCGDLFGPSLRHIRVGADHLPVPSSKALEWQVLPQVSTIVDRVLDGF